MNQLELCVWMNGCEGLSADLLRDFTPEDTYEGVILQLKESELVTDNCVQKLRKLEAMGWAEDEINRAENAGVSLISWYDEKYPERLREIDAPPLVLYVRGHMPDFEHAWSVVGTRRCTGYGHRVAERIGSALARAGIPVVSGGASGIDGAAHGGALAQDGVTVAVLGTGIDILWPVEHTELFESILEKGALISEFPFGTRTRKWRFPRRNRIIAGISRGLVVVESPIKGGAMITATRAMEYGRGLWAVPGRIDETVCEGSNQLLMEGASPLVNVSDFIHSISNFCQQLEMPTITLSAAELSDDERKILNCLAEQGDLMTDQIAWRLDMKPVEVLQILSGLQIAGRVYSSGGGRWSASPQ